jgi:hypothetical protein
MKKTIMILLTVFAVITSVSCNKTEDEEQQQDEKVVELIQDNYFVNGFTISPADNEPQPDNRYPLDYDLTYGTTNGKISWLVGQAGSRFGLADYYAFGKEVSKIGEFYIIEDYSKNLKIDPINGIVKFELNTSKEYLHPRKPKEAWPHLLLQQGLSRNVMVNEVESIDLSLSITLDKLNLMMEENELDPSLHTAQFLMYIVVRSTNAQDANEFIWFGIPFFDARYHNLPESGMIDAGTAGNTGKFIYQMPGDVLLPNGLPIGEKQTININIVPYLKRAIVLAQSYDKMLNTTIDDLYLTNMNIGFEIPGTYDIGITIEKLSLKATFKDD